MQDLKTIAGRRAFVTPHAQGQQLSVALVCAVIEQESTWDPEAFRYESGFYRRYIVPMALNDRTEAHLRASSFGLMQIMGQTAREFGFAGAALFDLCDPDLGVQFGCKKLERCFSLAADVDGALLHYNGGSNTDYPRQVLARVAAYQ